MTTTTDTAATERRELEPCDESLTSPRPWRLVHGGAIVDANGVVILKIWNGWNNAALAVNTVNSHAALEAERDALAQHLHTVGTMLKETAFSYHVEAEHKSAFAVCANVFCSQACYTWNKLNEKPALGETK